MILESISLGFSGKPPVRIAVSSMPSRTSERPLETLLVGKIPLDNRSISTTIRHGRGCRRCERGLSPNSIHLVPSLPRRCRRAVSTLHPAYSASLLLGLLRAVGRRQAKQVGKPEGGCLVVAAQRRIVNIDDAASLAEAVCTQGTIESQLRCTMRNTPGAGSSSRAGTGFRANVAMSPAAALAVCS